MDKANNSFISLLVVDDHKLFRSGIISMFEDVPDIMVIGEAETGQEAVNKYFELQPDLILMDINMPQMSGTNAYKEIKKSDPNCKVLFLTMYDGEEYIFYTLRIGGMGLLTKNTMKGELIYAIKSIHEGTRYFGRAWTNEKLEELKKKYRRMAHKEMDQYGVLTEKEKEVLNYISSGITSQEIAEHLNLSKRTIDSHRAKLMQKLNIKSLPELITYAIKFSTANRILDEEEPN